MFQRLFNSSSTVHVHNRFRYLSILLPIRFIHLFSPVDSVTSLIHTYTCVLLCYFNYQWLVLLSPVSDLFFIIVIILTCMTYFCSTYRCISVLTDIVHSFTCTHFFTYHMDYLLHWLSGSLFRVLHCMTSTSCIIIIFLWYIFILSVTYYTIMVICIIIYHTDICLLFRLPLLLQRLQLVILFYFIISHITLHVFLVTPHGILFISVSTSFHYFLLGFFYYYMVRVIIVSVCHSGMHTRFIIQCYLYTRFDYSFIVTCYCITCICIVMVLFRIIHDYITSWFLMLFCFLITFSGVSVSFPYARSFLLFITTLYLVPFTILVLNCDCIVISFITIV
jgi:hypothetical protein